LIYKFSLIYYWWFVDLDWLNHIPLKVFDKWLLHVFWVFIGQTFFLGFLAFFCTIMW